MKEAGLYLTNTDEWWNVQKSDTLLVEITLSIHASISDFVICKAKEMAEERNLETFGIVHVNFCGGRNMLYTSS